MHLNVSATKRSHLRTATVRVFEGTRSVLRKLSAVSGELYTSGIIPQLYTRGIIPQLY